ncbi:MAG: guanitoxin biosynthesis MATE family efflux transporter GntT [Scytonema sp. PMC 1069.18]|nr:guanitoxin biosynthesis MATE family efflux transporter GntT [Scytonema sp. PMC 1069.18]MEC4886205.1 guanitoxin biosynthesis MATE family efflux transporter GntT [Scytonema sp. PMC 1070.18]
MILSNLTSKHDANHDLLNRFSRLAIINILSGIMVPLAGLVDIAFLGHLADIRYLAGVVLATILFDYLYRVLKFIRSSTNSMTAQAVGRDDTKDILLVGLRNGFIALGIAALILIFQYPLRELGFAVLSATPEVKDAGVAYFNARIWGAPAVLLNYVLIGWFFGQELNGFVLLMSLIGNGANVVLDYLMIIKWGWESSGAGLATAISQYLALLVGLMFVCCKITWQGLPVALHKVFDGQALKAAFALNGNILVRYLVLISALAVFTNLSSAMGTTILAENGLLLQIVTLSFFVIQGVGHATQSLTGHLKGKGESKKLLYLITVATLTSLSFALPFAIASILFPKTLFGLLTNHAEVTNCIDSYTSWLLPVLGFAAIAFMLEGYFIGLTEGSTLRNSAITSMIVGFLPVAFIAWYIHSNHALWLALSLYMATSVAILLRQLPKTLS